LELVFGSEFPTTPALEQAAMAARAAALALTAEEDVWCSSEAPTGVAAERPILPGPPRTPRIE
jgi:hypothetical protein